MSRSALAMVKIKWHARTTCNKSLIKAPFLKQSINVSGFSCSKEPEGRFFLQESPPDIHVARRTSIPEDAYTF